MIARMSRLRHWDGCEVNLMTDEQIIEAEGNLNDCGCFDGE